MILLLGPTGTWGQVQNQSFQGNSVCVCVYIDIYIHINVSK